MKLTEKQKNCPYCHEKGAARHVKMIRHSGLHNGAYQTEGWLASMGFTKADIYWLIGADCLLSIVPNVVAR